VRRDFPDPLVALVLYAPRGYVREIIENAGLAALFIIQNPEETVV
jgi:hypothetical protein